MSIFTNIIETIRQGLNNHKTINEMHKMTDSELNDIGINRCDIERVVYGILTVHRGAREEKK